MSTPDPQSLSSTRLSQPERENPFRVAQEEPKSGIPEITHKSYRSIYFRILAIFFILAVTPLALYALFDTVVHFSMLHGFWPSDAVVTADEVLFTQMILTLLLAVIIVVFAAAIISSSLIRPLRRLLELTHLVGEGKLNYRLKVSSLDEVGELTQAFNVMVARLRAQQARERMMGQLKSEFISIAAHQLRTPLSATKWTFRMLIDGDMGAISEEQKQFLQRGYQTNEHMIGLINDLLDASRIEQGHFGYDFKPVDFAAYIRSFLGEYWHQAESHQITIVFQDLPAALPPINIDKSKMDLVLQNILDNAVKYSKAGGHITISMKMLEKYLEITIADHGVGIPQYQMERVFTKFFRGDNVVRMSTEGSGLGLFIVKNIVKNHGGDIHIESEENKGTKVIFTVPIDKNLIPKKETVFEEFATNL